MKCSEVMTKDPACCLPSDTAQHAAQLMKTEDVGPIPIVDDAENKKLQGIITDRDLVLKVVADARDAKTTLLADVMTKDLITCAPDDKLESALSAMERHQVRRIPVVDGKNHLLGIISQADVATRIGEPEKTAEVVHEISRAA